MLAQKRNKIIYKHMFSNFFKFPIRHLTHPPTSKVFLDFWNLFLFTWPLNGLLLEFKRFIPMCACMSAYLHACGCDRVHRFSIANHFHFSTNLRLHRPNRRINIWFRERTHVIDIISNVRKLKWSCATHQPPPLGDHTTRKDDNGD